jgi:hypothetical protein
MAVETYACFFVTRRLAEERPRTRQIVTQSSTVCGTLLRHYSPVPEQSAGSASATSAETVPSDHAERNRDGAVFVRNYQPTFGISLNELKAAIAPRASAIHHYQPSDCVDEADRQVSNFELRA